MNKAQSERNKGRSSKKPHQKKWSEIGLRKKGKSLNKSV
jgi:hypothetical protein